MATQYPNIAEKVRAILIIKDLYQKDMKIEVFRYLEQTDKFYYLNIKVKSILPTRIQDLQNLFGETNFFNIKIDGKYILLEFELEHNFFNIY